MKNLLWRRAGAEPGVVAVGLKHQDAGQAAHPVDISEAGWSGGWSTRHRMILHSKLVINFAKGRVAQLDRAPVF